MLPTWRAHRVDNAPVARLTRRKTALTAGLFVAGFSTVFVTLGVGASAVGRLLRLHASELAVVAGVVIIAMGLHFLGLTRISLFMRQARFEMRRPIGLWGAYVMGLAFGFGWTPCVGPMLAAILAISAADATAAKGAGLLGVYSLGLGLPFMAAALAVGPFAAFIDRFRVHLPRVEQAMGALLVLTGVGFLTGAFARASFWLIEIVPALERLG
jgi:cytochrome c-type biogenesis protein